MTTKKAPAAPAVDGMTYDGTFTIGPIGLKIVGGGVEIHHSSVGDKAGVHPAGINPTGFKTNGEMKLHFVTLSVDGQGAILLRRENIGAPTEVDRDILVDLLETVYFAESKKGEDDTKTVSDVALGSVLDEAFFSRKIEADGNVTTRLQHVKNPDKPTSEK